MRSGEGIPEDKTLECRLEWEKTGSSTSRGREFRMVSRGSRKPADGVSPSGWSRGSEVNE